jgi:hypothetical protein
VVNIKNLNNPSSKFIRICFGERKAMQKTVKFKFNRKTYDVPEENMKYMKTCETCKKDVPWGFWKIIKIWDRELTSPQPQNNWWPDHTQMTHDDKLPTDHFYCLKCIVKATKQLEKEDSTNPTPFYRLITQ